MSIDKCTPGKWSVNKYSGFEVVSDNGAEVADCGDLTDAKLIASSKDMYEALLKISKCQDKECADIAFLAIPEL